MRHSQRNGLDGTCFTVVSVPVFGAVSFAGVGTLYFSIYDGIGTGERSATAVLTKSGLDQSELSNTASWTM